MPRPYRQVQSNGLASLGMFIRFFLTVCPSAIGVLMANKKVEVIFKLHYFDLLWICCTISWTQQIEVMKFERNVVPASSAPTRPVYVTAPFIRRPSELLLFLWKET